MDERNALLVLRRPALVAAVLALLAASSWCRAEVPEGWNAATAPDSSALVSGDWRLTSPVFSMPPPGGFPIRFLADGHVESDNLAGVEGWALIGGRLLLYGKRQSVNYQFQWNDSTADFERHLDPDQAGAPEITIARLDAPADSSAQASKPFVLPDAVIGTADDARRLALQAYFKSGGVRALESAHVMDAFAIGAEVPGFAHPGDRVWEVRIHETSELSAIIWINAGTGAAYTLFPRAEAPAQQSQWR